MLQVLNKIFEYCVILRLGEPNVRDPFISCCIFSYSKSFF